MKWPFDENAGSLGENGTFLKFFVLPDMCHLSSQPTLLSHESQFMTKKRLKIKLPDSPVENGTFLKIFVLPKMCHLSNRGF